MDAGYTFINSTDGTVRNSAFSCEDGSQRHVTARRAIKTDPPFTSATSDPGIRCEKLTSDAINFSQFSLMAERDYGKEVTEQYRKTPSRVSEPFAVYTFDNRTARTH